MLMTADWSQLAQGGKRNRESYWKDILSKLPQMASESKGLRMQTQAFFFRESQNNS